MSADFVPLRKQQGINQQQCRSHNSSTSTSSQKMHMARSTAADTLRSRHGIEVEDSTGDVPDPITTFDEMVDVPHRLKTFLKRTKRLMKPTPVQMQAIGCLQSSRDVICLSATGTGKTLAYLLPLCSFLWKHRGEIRHLRQQQNDHQQSQEQPCRPLCLVIVPTRELMHQVLENTQELVDAMYPFEEEEEEEGNRGRGWYGEHSNNYANLQSTQYHPYRHHHQQQYAMMNSQQPYLIDQRRLQFPLLGAASVSRPGAGNNANSNNSNSNNNIHDQSYRQPSSYFNQMPHQQGSRHQQNCVGIGTPASVVVGLCGGTPIREDVAKLKQESDRGQPSVVIATPGRLLDLATRNLLGLGRVRYLVIDECDRILDMGMEEQLRQIVAMVTVVNNNSNIAISPVEIRTSLWSATLPESLERIARSAVVDPVYVCCGIKNSVPQNIHQEVRFVHTYQKPELLLEVLRHQTAFPPVIVFASSKEKVDYVTEMLQDEQFHAAALHSGYPQEHRNNVVRSFRSDEIDILVATDLASRGLDVPAVTHVINYDTPDTIEDYVHRVGRTGRFGRQGHVTTFLTLDCRIAGELRDLLEASRAEIPPQLLRDTKMFGGNNVLHTDMGDRVVS